MQMQMQLQLQASSSFSSAPSMTELCGRYLWMVLPPCLFIRSNTDSCFLREIKQTDTNQMRCIIQEYLDSNAFSGDSDQIPYNFFSTFRRESQNQDREREIERRRRFVVGERDYLPRSSVMEGEESCAEEYNKEKV